MKKRPTKLDILSQSFLSAHIECFEEHVYKPELTIHFVSVKIAICAYEVPKDGLQTKRDRDRTFRSSG